MFLEETASGLRRLFQCRACLIIPLMPTSTAISTASVISFKLDVVHPNDLCAVCVNDLLIKYIPDNKEVILAEFIRLEALCINL